MDYGSQRYGLSGSTTQAKSVGRPDNFYPSPFFDVAKNYIPKTIKETFDWCHYYQLTNPLINSVTQKLATYPITDLVYEDDNEGVVDIYRDLFEKQFLLRSFLIETNLDRYTYGNSFISIAFPFTKILKCTNCGFDTPAKRSGYKWKGFQFFFDCSECGHYGAAKVSDEPVKSSVKISLIRWNPQNIIIKYNEITGKYLYYYKIPRGLRNDITLGKPDVLETIPQAFIDAIRKKKSILLDSDKIFHSRRPSISRAPSDSGWGAPLILPVLKDIFFLQVLRKAQEAVAMEHVVPMRVMFPQITADGNNPYAQINLQDWQKEVQTQIRRWRQDNNHIPVMPVPIGYQMIGGNGRSLLLHQEIRIYSDQIIAGMGVPTGFFYGEAQYSGASVNLRALENEFLGNRQDMLRCVEFIRDRVAHFLNLPRIKLRFKPFKMADDIQRAAFDMNLANAGMISRRTFLQSRDFNFDNEVELINKENQMFGRSQREQQIRQTESQGESMLIQTRYQIQSQNMQQENQMQMQQQYGPPPGAEQQAPQGQEQQGQEQQQAQQQAQPPAEAQQEQQAPAQEQQAGGVNQGVEQSPVANQSPMVDLFAQAKKLTSELNKMNEVDRYRALAQIRASNPDLYMLVNNALSGQGMAPMRPLPEQKPPRSGPGSAQI
jgi:hypothetical protein|tara:strand:- start:12059 stop:14035 length:1977 start_codon:yes stop_codon:yes gene_type:complete